jgi:hypothetical protein
MRRAGKGGKKNQVGLVIIFFQSIMRQRWAFCCRINMILIILQDNQVNQCAQSLIFRSLLAGTNNRKEKSKDVQQRLIYFNVR